jgi:hypothetical protein
MPLGCAEDMPNQACPGQNRALDSRKRAQRTEKKAGRILLRPAELLKLFRKQSARTA